MTGAPLETAPGLANTYEGGVDVTEHITPQTTDKIPYGYCHCGCGQLAPLAPHTMRKKGVRQGEPLRYIHNHHNRGKKLTRRTTPVTIRFWRYVTPGPVEECWLWQGSLQGKGYGNIQGDDKRNVLAHRLSYMLHSGPIPDDMVVCHHCDTPACVNPHHLFLGTQSENHADMRNKGRAKGNPAKGSDKPTAKLTDAKVQEIRALAAQGVYQRNIAKQYHLSQATVWSIIHRQTWKHVP